jgi:hypothetical protein
MIIFAFFRVLTAVFRICIHSIRARIRIQHFRPNTDQDPDPIRIQGSDDQKLKKFTAKKKLKNYNLPIPRSPERTSKLQKKPSAIQREQHFNKCNSKFFSTSVDNFSLLDPDSDPDSESGSRYGSTDLTFLNPDPIRIRIRNTA